MISSKDIIEAMIFDNINYKTLRHNICKFMFISEEQVVNVIRGGREDKDIGINQKIPVTGLQSNNPKAKADWIENKIDEEGYDDIYFADDSIKNVEAVKSMLRTKNVKWRVQHIKH